MNFSLYYYIPWPESQYYEDLDPDHLFCEPSCTIEGGIFAQVAWVKSIASNKIEYENIDY